MAINEDILVRKASEGDVAAFEQLVSQYQKTVFNIALRMLGNNEDAAEAAQEALIKAYRSIPAFRRESSFSTWIYRIVVNNCMDYLRRNKKHYKLISLDQKINCKGEKVSRQIKAELPDPYEVLEKKDLKLLIKNELSKLTDKHRTVIILRDFQGLNYKEISDILGCREGTVKSRLSRARNELKKRILKSKELFEEYIVQHSGKEGENDEM